VARARRPILVGLVAAAVVLAGMRVAGLGFYRVVGESMLPAYRPDELLLVSEARSAAARGQVVVAALPIGGTSVLKRVVGLPGDTVTLEDGAVWINGTKIEEPYLAPGSLTLAEGEVHRWILGTDEYFLLGDNRAQSSDSRTFGAFPRSALVATASFRYWPLDRVGAAP
jgi:signal peptidase I